MLVEGGRGPEMFLELIPKCSTRFSNVFIGAVYVWAFEFVDNFTLFKFVTGPWCC